MKGGIEETSAPFEARSAPRSHPTNCDIRTQKHQTKINVASSLADRHPLPLILLIWLFGRPALGEIPKNSGTANNSAR
jgi:hypothetical protein